MNCKTRYIEHVGTAAYLRVYWRDTAECLGNGYHDARVEVARSDKQYDESIGGYLEDYKNDPSWPLHCDTCKRAIPVNDDNLEINRQLFRAKLFNTKSGNPEPGDLYYVDYECFRNGNDYCVSGWSNCDGKHLHCVLPNGMTWDIDGRASNCTNRQDGTHRCWVRHGNPETELITVDKNGNTCLAGSGSISVKGWHGFLRGFLVEC